MRSRPRYLRPLSAWDVKPLVDILTSSLTYKDIFTMKNFLSIAVSVALLSACVSTPNAQNYRPAGSNDAQWQFTGSFNKLSGDLKIAIDGTDVLTGTLSFIGNNGELSGKYQNKSVTASCGQHQTLFKVSTDCMIFVNNERAATLEF